jgi:GAF domain-containing protein
VRGQVIGTLDVWPQADQLSVNEENLLNALADRLGQFLENSRLYENAQQTARLEKLTSDVATQMRASLNLETVLRTAVDEIYEAMDLDDLVIQLTPDLTDN